MRLIILSMLSSSSLSAFSAAINPNPVSQPPRLRPVRSVGSEPQASSAVSTSGAGATGGIPSVAPSQMLPRGSLLNLSV